MLALIIPALNTVVGGIIRPFIVAWTDYERTKLTTNEVGFEAASKSDASVMISAIAADVQLSALKIQVYGHGINRAVMWIAGLPAALHFGFVFIDTILASKFAYGVAVLGVPKLPSPYDTYEWAIVTSFFLVHGVQLGKGNVSEWLDRNRGLR